MFTWLVKVGVLRLILPQTIWPLRHSFVQLFVMYSWQSRSLTLVFMLLKHVNGFHILDLICLISSLASIESIELNNKELTNPKDTANAFYHPQQSCRKVKFSVVCVCQSVCRRRSHVTITHDALALTVQGPPTPNMGPQCTGSPLALVPANGIRWPRLESCSKLLTWGSPA